MVSARKNISIADPKTLESGKNDGSRDPSRSGDSLGSELSPPAKIISPASKNKKGFSISALVEVEHREANPADKSASASVTLEYEQNQEDDSNKDRILAIQNKVFENNKIGRLIQNNQFENQIQTRLAETIV